MASLALIRSFHRPVHRVRWAAALIAVLVAGCASMPDTQLLKRQYNAHAVELRNAWGPVSERTKAAALAAVKSHDGQPDILDRQIAIEQAVVGTPLVLENKVTLLIDGPATYRAMFAAMRAARHTLNIEFYIIEDDPVGREFADILIERSRAGVRVNLIYDSFGVLKTGKDYFARLREAGVQMVEFNPLNPLASLKPWKIGHRDHRKQVIVDGRTVFLGGINIDDVYATSSGNAGRGSSSGSSSGGGSKKELQRSGWRDTDVQIDGPVAADFEKLFLETWEKQHGPPLRRDDYFPKIPPAGKELVRAIGSTPDNPVSKSYLTFIAALTHAQKQVFITNAYFVPDPQLVDALLDAARRGVDVRLILPSTTDTRTAAYAAHAHYARLLAGGVKIYERRAALLHAKTAVIDGVWSCVGSSNLDWRSAVDNDELNAVIISRDFAQTMLKAYAADEAQSDEITLDAWRHRPWRDRLQEWTVRLFERLL